MYRYSILALCCLLISCVTEKDKNWQDLFNGENLEGWHVYGGAEGYDGWTVANGELQFDFRDKKGAESSSLVTDSLYTNFELSIEWKISKQGNSGVFWGVVEDTIYKHPYQTGPEIQILDDEWTTYIEARGDITRAGAIFNLMAPQKIVSKPADQWNKYLLHIDHGRNYGSLHFNGHEVLRFKVNGDAWNEQIAKSPFADWPGFGKAQTGRISLQDHGGQVAFRNIKIRRLPDES